MVTAKDSATDGATPPQEHTQQPAVRLGGAVVALGVKAEERVREIVQAFLIKMFGYGVVALAFGLCVYFFTEMYGFNGRLSRAEGVLGSAAFSDYIRVQKEVGILQNIQSTTLKECESITTKYNALRECVLHSDDADKRGCIK